MEKGGDTLPRKSGNGGVVPTLMGCARSMLLKGNGNSQSQSILVVSKEDECVYEPWARSRGRGLWLVTTNGISCRYSYIETKGSQ